MPINYFRRAKRDLKLYLKMRSTRSSNGCIEWTGPKDNDGYGNCQINKKDWRAHRLAYSVYNNISREDMEGLLVCHKCDNPSCINPDHLYLGTHFDNNRDTVKRGRHVNVHQKLSREEAEEIRDLFPILTRNNFMTQKQIAEMYGVTPGAIYHIVKGLSYAQEV